MTKQAGTAKSHHSYHPIIFVRGFAATQGEIEDAVSDPFNGFNLGSTKSRLGWNGDFNKHYFESPVVRLMSDHGYDDIYEEGQDLLVNPIEKSPLKYKSLVIYRYYEMLSQDFGDKDDDSSIERFAENLGKLILLLRDRICENPANKIEPEDFKVYLVAHSMGGLICRSFLQGEQPDLVEARRAVDKLFTYATPHNGIDLGLLGNVPNLSFLGDVRNFNRKRMAAFLRGATPDDASIVEGFPPERIFNLVGTNARDYGAAKGLSSLTVGEDSDGLVKVKNATTHGPGKDGEDVTSPRAFVHRSHSGPYGIVNSEEGYQNLTRFLFGKLRVDGILDVDSITLPKEVQAEKDKGKEIKASYQFESSVSVRGCLWQLSQRKSQDKSAIFRKYDELFPEQPSGKRTPDRSKSPHLFSVFLDPEKSMKGNGSVCFAVDLKLLVPDYEVDRVLFLKRHFDGATIYNDWIVIEASRDKTSEFGWKVRYRQGDSSVTTATKPADLTKLPGDDSGLQFSIPIAQNIDPGLTGTLRFEIRPWS